MEYYLSFDLKHTGNRQIFDISFKKKDQLKKIPHELPKILEKCEEEEEEDDPLIIIDDYSEEEDNSIIKIYEGIRYVLFPGIDSLYTEKDLRYVGYMGGTLINFTPIGEDIHRTSLKNN
tara:strand:+ start:966 stop:1322 length:357 start_codon:yes stop_codon:yes gene_type:complete